jgi:CRISPR-associated protein Cmr3
MKTNMTIEISALDTLFFRDGKPFERGDENWATGTFPPMPSVIYGALRTAYLGENPSQYNNIETLTNDLEIKKIILQIPNEKEQEKRKTHFLPMPLDLIKYKNDAKIEYLKLSKLENNVVTRSNNSYILKATKPDKVEEGQFLINLYDFQELYQYENQKNAIDKNKPILPKKITEIIQNEPKLGIARNNNSHITENGMLYRVSMQRAENWKAEKINFLIEFEKLSITQQKGFFKLGGEGKTIHYNTLSDSLDILLPEIKSEYFKVYLATPAIFENGWLPKIFQDKLITCAIGKPQMVGGFDIQKRMPKAMQKAVPAGSVYYIKTESVPEAQKLAKELHSNSISEYRQKEGFGICYIGQITQNLDGI